MILAFALCATAAAFVGPSVAPQKTTALQHHKVRSQVADLKIYREEIDWETGEVVKREVEETVDDLVAKQPVKLKYTYEERRGEEGQKLALPPVFGGVGLCGNQNFTVRSAESSRRPPRHRRDACSMAWWCSSLTARSSQDGRVIAEK
jgi:hypothetical protein